MFKESLETLSFDKGYKMSNIDSWKVNVSKRIVYGVICRIPYNQHVSQHVKSIFLSNLNYLNFNKRYFAKLYSHTPEGLNIT